MMITMIKFQEVSDDYENILIDLMPDDLGISSMHLSGKLFQMIDNKNKTMIVEMKAHDFFSYAFSMFFTLSCLYSCEKIC